MVMEKDFQANYHLTSCLLLCMASGVVCALSTSEFARKKRTSYYIGYGRERFVMYGGLV
jgi:hypothetical protein